MLQKLQALYALIVTYINTHPKVKGLLVTIEGAAIGVIWDACEHGRFPATLADCKHLFGSIAFAVGIAVRNYLRDVAKKPWDGTDRRSDNNAAATSSSAAAGS